MAYIKQVTTAEEETGSGTESTVEEVITTAIPRITVVTQFQSTTFYDSMFEMFFY